MSYWNFNIPTWGWGWWSNEELFTFEQIINSRGEKYIGEDGVWIIRNGEDEEIYVFYYGKFKKIKEK